MKKPLILFLCLFGTIGAIFSQFPVQNLYKLDFNTTGQHKIVSKITMLTPHNLHSYNNQPYFYSDSTILFTSSVIPDTPQTDIYSLNIYNGALLRWTNTREAEYSPTFDRVTNSLNCVRVEANKKDQILVSYKLSEQGKSKNLIKLSTGVGYYIYVDNLNIAFFEVGDPHQLFVFNTSTGLKSLVDSNIGRCLKSDSEGNLFYVKKMEKTKELRKFNVLSGSSNLVKVIEKDGEDFILQPNERLWLSAGSHIYETTLNEFSPWRSIFDGKSAGIHTITRLAMNAKGTLVIVGN